MAYSNKCYHKGFTLIELMVVVVIVGILAALSVSMYRTASDKARYAGAKIWLKRIYQALEEYYYDYGCYPPDVGPNTPPSNLVPEYLEKWPTPSRDAFHSMYDYENHICGGVRSVGITYLGKDKTHQLQWCWALTHGTVGEIMEIPDGDDLFIVVAQDVETCE